MDKSDSKYCDCAVTLPFSNARIAADRGRADAGVVIAKSTAVPKITIEQFWAIPLTGKVVAGPSNMAMPPCVLYRVNPVANQMPEA
jgi:hypothetical protein